MHDARRVRDAERLTDLAADVDGSLDRDAALALEALVGAALQTTTPSYQPLKATGYVNGERLYMGDRRAS